MKPSRIVLAVLVIAGIVAPFTALIPGWTVGLATVVYFNALSAIGLNLIFGVTGLLSARTGGIHGGAGLLCWNIG